MTADEKAYARFLSGDEAGLTELIEIYRNPLSDFINAYIKDEHDSQDIMLDVFVDLVRKNRFRGESSLKTYLFAVARNKALKHISRKKAQTIEFEQAQNYIPLAADANAQLISEEERQAVRSAVRSLKPEYREAIHLIYFEDMTYEQAAAVMKKSKKQISNYVFRAKQQLREILKEEAGQ